MTFKSFFGFPGGSDSKESTCNMGDLGSVPGLGRFPGRGCGNPLQCSCLENSHGQRSLEGYSLWGLRESDTAEQLSTRHTHTVVVITGWQGSKWMTLLGHILMTLLETLQWFPLHVERPPRPAISARASFLTLLEPQNCSPCVPYSSLFQAQGSSISPSHCLRELPWWRRW